MLMNIRFVCSVLYELFVQTDYDHIIIQNVLPEIIISL